MRRVIRMRGSHAVATISTLPKEVTQNQCCIMMVKGKLLNNWRQKAQSNSVGKMTQHSISHYPKYVY